MEQGYDERRSPFRTRNVLTNSITRTAAVSAKLFFLILFFTAPFLPAQQNEEFASTKKFFDYQRFMLNQEFKKQYEKEKNAQNKLESKEDYSEFMQKLDSIQNKAYINTLIKVKNREDLSRISAQTLPALHLKNPVKEELSADAQYPGGFEMLRAQVADLFYSESVLPHQKLLKTDVVFVVEKDGSISDVQAQGDNFTFNRQAEIAVYLLPDKFSPATINGQAVRYRFRLPLTMSFD